MAHGIQRVGVCGAGTMGAGIAQVCALAGFRVMLYDAIPEALPRALERIRRDLERAVERGRLGRDAQEQALARIVPTEVLEALGPCELVIEAAPEDLHLKQDLFRRLGEVCPASLLATNTSSLSVAEIAAATPRPDRVAGLHFFNPAPAMPLVEVVRAPRTAPEAVERLVAFARDLGKTPIVVRDRPGFVVNRVNRPFYGEALRMVGEGLADPPTVDHALRGAGGFRMGPFELMDLVGIDVGYAVSQALYQAFFGESRFRPHPLQREMVLSGRLGRKTGGGFYGYEEGRTPPSPPLSLPEADPGPYAVAGRSDLAGELVRRLRDRGYTVVEVPDPPRGPLPVRAVFEAEVEDRDRKQEMLRGLDGAIPGEAVVLAACTNAACAECAAWVRRPERLAGYVTLPPLADRKLLEWTVHERTEINAEPYLAALGLPLLRVGDGPGGVFPRVLATLVNEAAFACGEGVATPEDVDTAMRLGTNHPFGPFTWAERVGIRTLVGILEGLQVYYGEERYRTAPWLRRAAWMGRWPGGRVRDDEPVN